MSKNNIQMVIAVDFGTSRSGFAYAYTSKPDEIWSFTNWPEQKVPYVKTLTQLLYDQEGNFLAWGYPARSQYAELCKTLKREQRKRILGGTPTIHELHREEIAKKFPTQIGGFKMLLKPDSGSDHAEYVDEAGRIFPAKKLIVDYLRELKNFIFDLLSRKVVTFKKENIKWCLTIPAIWNEADKHLMREAAVEAEIVDEISSEKLILALEPEAAALAFVETNNEKLPNDSRFMIVDAGGGTVDLTVHEIDNENLKEVVRGSGGACGSTYLDQRFTHYIKELIGNEIYEEMEIHHPEGIILLMDAWERAKCDVKASLEKTVFIPIPTPIWRFLSKKDDVLERIADFQDGEDEDIVLDPEKLNFIYDSVLQDVEDAIREQIKILDESEDPRCERLVLVGGFAESPILQKRIKENFSTRFEGIHVLQSPGKAVVEGAVHFALRERIQSRRMRFTYGCEIMSSFREGIDPENKRKMIDDRSLCDERFSTFVKIGEEVRFDQVIKKSYYTSFKKQTNITFDFYKTDSPTPEYIDEEGMEGFGTMNMRFPSSFSYANREVVLTIFFGRTTIQVEGMDISTGTKVSVHLDFK